MDWLNKYDDWQIECLIFSSQLMLNLLSKEDVVTFIHRLMDKGLYDDLMLNIIDDDPIFPSSDFRQTYQQIAQNLKLPFPSIAQAEWLLTLKLMLPFLVKPNNYYYFQENQARISYKLFKPFFDNWQEIYQDIEEFRYLLYRIDDAIFDYSYRNQQSFKDLEFIQSLETEFFLLVDGWFNRNSVRLENIFNELLDRK